MNAVQSKNALPKFDSGRDPINGANAAFGYVYGLDALRLFAVAIVVIRHYEIVMILPGGFGVSLFFFISGFLISRLLLAEEKRYGTIFLGKFYVRRFIRLLPPLLLMGAIAVPILYLMDPSEFSPIQVLLSFLYFGNLMSFMAPALDWKPGYEALEPLWSLAVEEHFYLILPPLLLIVRSTSGRIWLMLAAIILPLLIRIFAYAFLERDFADQFNYHFTLTRLDSMAWGVLLTLILESGHLRLSSIEKWAHHLFWGGGIIILLTMVHWTEFYEIAIKYTPQSAAIGLLFAGLIFSVKYRWIRNIMEARPILHLGRITYEIYLWHFPVWVVIRNFVESDLAAASLSILVTIVISDLAFRLTTKRLVNWRKRFGAHPVL